MGGHRSFNQIEVVKLYAVRVGGIEQPLPAQRFDTIDIILHRMRERIDEKLRTAAHPVADVDIRMNGHHSYWIRVIVHPEGSNVVILKPLFKTGKPYSRAAKIV